MTMKEHCTITNMNTTNMTASTGRLSHRGESNKDLSAITYRSRWNHFAFTPL